MIKGCGGPAFAGRQAERGANMFACAKGEYANIFVRYSEGDRTNVDDCYEVKSPK